MAHRNAMIFMLCITPPVGPLLLQTVARIPMTPMPSGRTLSGYAYASTVAGSADQDGIINVRSYGATGDGVTDDSAAIQMAIEAAEAANGATVFFPPGRYRANIVLDEQGNANVSRMPMLRGSGPYATWLRSYTPGQAVIKMTGGTSWSWPWAISDLTIRGHAAAMADSNGLETPDHPGVVALRCENVAFRDCNYGVHHHGELWYTFENCTFKANNIGVRAEWTTARDNHGGCGYFAQCNFQSNRLAAAYLEGTGQITFTDCVNEDNPGLGFLIRNGTSAHPITFRNTWFENNGTAGTVEIDGVTYVLNEHPVWPCHGWIDDGGVVLFENLNMPPMKILGYSFVQAERCHFRYADRIDAPDATTIFSAPRSTYEVTNNSHGWPNSHYSPESMLALVNGTPQRYDSRHVKIAWRTMVTSVLAWDVPNLLAQGSCSLPFDVEDPRGNGCSFVTDVAPPIWRTCLRLDLKAGQTEEDAVRVWPVDIALTEGKWYVFTFDVRSNTGDGRLAYCDRFGANDVFCDARPVPGYHDGLVVSRDGWYRYAFVRQCPMNASITAWMFYNPGPGDTRFFLANAQFLEFDSAQWAYEFLCRNAYAPASEISRAAPYVPQ